MGLGSSLPSRWLSAKQYVPRGVDDRFIACDGFSATHNSCLYGLSVDTVPSVEYIEVGLRTEQKWERGEINPPLTALARIQEVFGCSWEALLGQPKCATRSPAKIED